MEESMENGKKRVWKKEIMEILALTKNPSNLRIMMTN